MKYMFALLGLAVAVVVADAGSISFPRRGKTVYTRSPDGRMVPRLTPGTGSDPVSDYGLGISGSFGGGGVQITFVESGSPAERVGMEVGDRILAVNGVPVTTAVSWANAMNGNAFVRLRIQDVRGTGVLFRDVNLGAPPPPIEPFPPEPPIQPFPPE